MRKRSAEGEGSTHFTVAPTEDTVCRQMPGQSREQEGWFLRGSVHEARPMAKPGRAHFLLLHVDSSLLRGGWDVGGTVLSTSGHGRSDLL